MPRSLLLVIASVLTLSGPWVASTALAQAPQAPKAQVDPEARMAFEAGADAYDHGRFADALRYFERAYAISPTPKLLFNIGRAADGDGQTERAVSAYKSYLEAFPNAENREFVESRIAKLETPAPAPVAAPVSLAPADVAAASLAAPSAPVAPAPVDEPKPIYKRAWFWGAVGVVAAGVITAAVVVAVKNHGSSHGPAHDAAYQALGER